MKCRTCARRLDLERLDYTKGCKHEQMEGFVCLACAFEGVAYWMTNISEDDYCEEYVEKQVKGDLISRQAAIDAAMEELDGGTPYDIPNKIMALPSANKSGHWIDDGDCSICSKCHEAYGLTSLGQLYTPNFCPNCGCDMRGGDDE